MDDNLTFDYSSKDLVNVTIFETKKISLKNIDFKVNDRNTWDYQMLLRTDGCVVDLNNISIKNDKKEFMGWFAGIYYSTKIDVENFNTENLLYGLVINYSRDVKAFNIKGLNTIHPITPCTFTKNVYVNLFRGTNTSIDAHVAINVHYNDVDIHTGDGYFNCRAIGVKLTNCRFRCSPGVQEKVVYIGASSFSKEFDYLYNEFDVELINVDWQHKIIWTNGLHVGRCRNLLIDKCKTHLIVTTGFMKNVKVKDSQIGKFQCYDSNFDLTNNHLIAKLQGIDSVISPLSCSWSGNAKIENCTFTGYDNAFLLDYVHGPGTEILFNNCKIDKVVGVVKKFGYPNNAYNKIDFQNCTVNNMGTIPVEMKLQKSKILKSNNIKKVN